MTSHYTFDVVVVGGGPSGATAANDLAAQGYSVMMLDRAGRIKPCGGAVPPRLIKDFAIPDHLIVAKVRSARIIAPSDKNVDMPIDTGGYVGMVDREVFDDWLRTRAVESGAVLRTGTFETFERDTDGTAVIAYRPTVANADGGLTRVRARAVIGADGALSQIAKQAVPRAGRVPFVFAYHEIVKAPKAGDTNKLTKNATPPKSGAYDGERCDVFYNGKLSPDFYAWIFPHGDHVSIGTGSAHKGFSLRSAVADLRAQTGLDGAETIRKEGAPIPMKPAKCWDNGRDVVLAGDAAGVVAPASGEGIYYAMFGGRLAAGAVDRFLVTGDARELAGARRKFMKVHGTVFWVLGIMQYFWYGSDKRRERFVKMCDDPDVQHLTWQSYMHKELVRKDPMAHVKIFFKDMAHLMGLART
jgi:geranylgeranyl diphosphate/geranylgeranyl-bacteriochlorophyllide a reductase